MITALRDTGTIPNHWTDAVYRTHAALLYDVEAALFRNDELTREEIRMVYCVAESLGVRIGSRVIDLACGPGRHSMQLAHEGHNVTGIDFSEHFLKIAAVTANERKPFAWTPQFACGDLRALQFTDGVFQTALILGNSLGFYSDEQNVRTLREAHRVLKDGAFLCLEITNKERYLAVQCLPGPHARSITRDPILTPKLSATQCTMRISSRVSSSFLKRAASTS